MPVLVELVKYKIFILIDHTVSQSIIDASDLVTEMKKIKHPYDDGILAKMGIDY